MLAQLTNNDVETRPDQFGGISINFDLSTQTFFEKM